MKSKAYVYKSILLGLAVMLLCNAVYLGYPALTADAKAAGSEGRVQIGKQAPFFELKGLDGQTYRIDGKRDKPLLLNFWASWCEPCRLEAPDLVKLAEKYKTELDVYGVNVTAYDDESKVKSFVDEFGIPFPVLMDRKEAVYSKYRGQAFPTQVLIDRNGIVREMIIGLLPPEDLEAKVRSLLLDK
ncbi:TlpA family protein disulfide reductase [Paenibacillus physcomitrellae]|uniref:Thioredoxin domain-containing protein n=1 Tax=Paenibacillus physcomitrellae TaxID=1619311 RepID=A0ABQ1GJ09_9BACL|nr:TlpA disulfide reductase family protein [Paenibacillus physcomitrellae]GGA44523.1 hypothetical protein GCM10010917_32280 [Paenibacillus physcomitrellae]